MMFNPDRKSVCIRALALASTGLSALFVTPASAQTMDFPQRFVDPDDFGTDLVTGKPVYSKVEGSIGTGDNALVLKRVWSGTGWQDNLAGKLYHTNEAGVEKVTLAMGLQSLKFTKVNGVYVPDNGDGSTLTAGSSGSGYTFTTASGVVYEYSNPYPISNPDPDDPIVVCQSSSTGSCLLVPTSRTSPDGAILTFQWQAGSTCKYNPKLPPETMVCTQRLRLQKVSDNTGLEMNISYVSGTAGTAGWSQKSIVQFKRAADTTPASTVSYAYSGGSINVTDPDGGQWNYQTGSGNLTLVQSPNSAITYTYNTAGKVSQAVKDGVARTYTYTTDASGNQVVTTGGDVTLVATTDLTVGRKKKFTDALGNVTLYEYDDKERLVRTTYPEGNKVQLGYNSNGLLVETRVIAKPGQNQPADIVTTNGYPLSCGNIFTCKKPLWSDDAAGNRTNFSYDPTHGQITKIEKPAPTAGAPRPTTVYEYGQFTYTGQTAPRNLVTKIRTCSVSAQCAGTANETVTEFTYDGNLRKSSATVHSGDNALTATISYQYYSSGLVSVVDGPLDNAVADDRIYYFYTKKRAISGIVYPDPDGAGPLPRRMERRLYTNEGRLTNVAVGTTTTTDLSSYSVAQEVVTTYDVNGRRVKDAVYAGPAATGTITAVTQYSYDSKGRLDCTAARMNPAVFGALPTSACTASTVGGAGPDRISKVTYDALSRPVQSTSGLGTTAAATEALAYTANGKTAWVEDAKGNRTTYTYDGFDRAVRAQYPDTSVAHASSSSDDEEYTYDVRGLLTSVTDRASGVHSMTYDALGRMTSKVSPNSEPTRSMTYDTADRLTSVSLAGDATPHSFTYDAFGRATSASNSIGTIGYQYDIVGRRTRMTWPDGLFVDYDYDAAGQMTKVRENGATSGIGVLATFAYDGLGRRTSLTYGNGVVQNYTFDSASRLATIGEDLPGSTDDVTTSFGYNAASQIAGTDRAGAGAAGRAWNSWSTTNRSYTVNGLNQYGTAGPVTFGYDTRGNLTSSASAGGTDTFTYSSENMLTSASGGVSLTYDPLGRLRQLVSPSSNTRFLYDGLYMIAEYDGGGLMTRRYVHGPDVDQPLAWYEGGTTSDRRFLLADERGSVVAVTSASGSLLGTNRYDEYGVPQVTYDGNGRAINSNIGRFQYTGQTWLPELGLYYYKARMYSPTLGRFMQTDPIGYADGMNWYNYVGGDPANKVDPTGTEIVVANGISYRLDHCVQMEGGPRFCSGTPIGVDRFYFETFVGLGNRIEKLARDVVCQIESFSIGGDISAGFGPVLRLGGGIQWNQRTGEVTWHSNYGVGYGVALSVGINGNGSTSSRKAGYSHVNTAQIGAALTLGGSQPVNGGNVEKNFQVVNPASLGFELSQTENHTSTGHLYNADKGAKCEGQR